MACHDDTSTVSLNAFGNAFLANGFALNATLEALDSDGDGATNGEELTASPATAPGDPNSKPGSSGAPRRLTAALRLPAATDGPTLYANHCAACHGALAGSTKGGATLARMQSAIAGNVGGMGFLSTLSTAQLQAIASALAPAAPTSSLNYTGMWWKPAESGWGINVNHQGDIVFATLFTYDERGAPMWVMMTGLLQADGRTYAGDLYQVSGPAFNAQPFMPITDANLVKVGTMALTFSSARTATLSYTYQGAAVSKDIVPQVFGTEAASCSATTGSRAALTNYQDMWWNPAESGWGVNIVHQNSTLFATLMTYDLAGNNLWLVMSAGLPQSDGSYLGDLYRASGPAFNAQPFTPITGANLAQVGTMRFTFTDGITGTLAYTVNGVPVSKSITRQVFASRVPACLSAVQPQAPQTADGPTLYASNCAACHGALASSTKAGRDADADAERHRRQRRRHGVPVGAVDRPVAGHRRGTRVGDAAPAADRDGRPDTLRKPLRGLPRRARELDQGGRDPDADAERHRRQRRRDGVPVDPVDRPVAGHRVGTGAGGAGTLADLWQLPWTAPEDGRARRAQIALVQHLPRRRLQLDDRELRHAQQRDQGHAREQRLEHDESQLRQFLPRQEVLVAPRRRGRGARSVGCGSWPAVASSAQTALAQDGPKTRRPRATGSRPTQTILRARCCRKRDR